MDTKQGGAPESTTKAPARNLTKKKRWPKILGIIAAVLIILVIVLWLVLDSLIVKGIETIGSKATGTPVVVESFSSSLLAGKVTIRNLAVGNPAGYQMPQALQFTSLEVQLQLSSLLSDTIVVERIIMDGLQVDLEPSLTRGSNLNEILNNVEAFTGASDAAAEKPAQAAEPVVAEETAPAKKVVIRLVEVRNSGIVIASKALGTEVSVPLPDLTMTDIGEQRSVGAAIQVFFSELLKAVGSAISGSGITTIDVKALGDGLSNAAQDAVNQLGIGLNSAAQRLGQGLSGAAESLTSGVSQASEGLTSGNGKVGEELKGGLNAIKELF